MRKKIIIVGITCVFLLISGICYSCSYQNKDSSVLVSAVVSEQNSGEEVIQKSEVETLNVANLETPTTMDTTGIFDATKVSIVTDSIDSQSIAEETTYIYVHICGAVISPGVYRAREGSRLIDFIQLAGGLTKKAAGDYINQAQLVADGQRIYIPDKEEIKDLTIEEFLVGEGSSSTKNSLGDTLESSENSDNGDSALININTANAEELMSISGIGEAKAASILAYREKNGKFNSIEDLMNIPGIKEGLFNQISYMIVAK